MVDRTLSPQIKDAVDFNLNLKRCETATLDNGVSVYTVDAGAQDVLQLELVFFAGNTYEDAPATASATNYLLKNGTKSRSAFAISEHFDFYGSFCSRACYNETAVVTLHTLSRHLPLLLPVLRDMITEATFPEDELSTYRQNSRQNLSVSLRKCDFVANRLIDDRIYGKNHPYGKYIVATDYDNLDSARLRDFYERHYVNGHCIIFASGKLPADLIAQLNTHFGGLTLRHHLQREKPVYPTIPLLSAATNRSERISNDPAGVQGAIRIGRPFPSRHHPDFQSVMVLNTLFGGYFGSRLMSNIREDKGYTYGIHSYVQNHLGDTAWLISTEAGKDVCEAAVSEVYREMKKLCEEPVDAEELHLVRNYMIGLLLGDLNGPFQLMGRWKNIVLNDLSPNYFDQSVRAIKQTGPDELRQLAQKYLQPEAFYELVVV
jgi:predicted Zn-dependent peptidase